jgi:hypothetical protein
MTRNFGPPLFFTARAIEAAFIVGHEPAEIHEGIHKPVAFHISPAFLGL